MQCKGRECCAAQERKNRHFLFAINQSFNLFRRNKFGALQTGHRLMMNIHGSNRTNADLAAVELRCQAYFFIFNELDETERMNIFHTKICR